MTKSPTIRLLFGLLITLLAVTGFCAYSLHQLSKLRRLQNTTIDLNRHDSLVLLRIQNDVNRIGLKLQDISERRGLSALSEYHSEFEAIRQDLEVALHHDAQFSSVIRRPDGQAALVQSVTNFWKLAEQFFVLANSGQDNQARKLAAGALSDQQNVLASRLAKLLGANNEAEELADQKIASIYDGVERDIYVFMIGAMAAIILTSSYLIYSNRRLFDRLESLSGQRRILAARLISVQEEVLRSVSRELHDEFGQILTAVGAMLARAERKGVPPDSPLRTELSEVREITHQTLEKMRSLSQMLHPAILDDYGLAKGIEWYAGVFERQAGIETSVHIEGPVVRLTGPQATHCFRIVQEALTNTAKHSGSKRVEITLVFSGSKLAVNIRDFGAGLPLAKKGQRPGLGLIAMHERAELLLGELKITSKPGEGTVISLQMPLRIDEDPALISSEETNEVLF